MASSTIVHEKIRCAFCQGRGTDPYNQLSEQSQCVVCQGEGLVSVPVPHVTCAYCHGTGSHKTFTCPVCDGTGVVEPLSGPTCVCPVCSGLGFDASSGLNCLRCRGLGRVSAEGHSE